MTIFVLAHGQEYIRRYLAMVAVLGLLWLSVAIAFGRWLRKPKSGRTVLGGMALAVGEIALTAAFFSALLS